MKIDERAFSAATVPPCARALVSSVRTLVLPTAMTRPPRARLAAHSAAVAAGIS